MRRSAARPPPSCAGTGLHGHVVPAPGLRSTVIPVAHWRYDFVAADGGCRVTESTWDRRPRWFRKIAGLATGVGDRAAANAEHIRLTLQRLKERAEAG